LLPLLLRLLLHLPMNHQKQLTRLLLLRLMRLPAKLQLMKRLMRRRLQRWTQMTR
jgi:hypothetical protein